MATSSNCSFSDLRRQSWPLPGFGNEFGRGGHNIPEPVIRRRFEAGLRNFEKLYKPAVDEWALYDNSASEPILIEEVKS